MDTSEEAALAVFDSLLLLNDVLPPEFQIQFGNAYFGEPPSAGDIIVAAVPPADIQSECGFNAIACALTSSGAAYSHHAVLYIPDAIQPEQVQAVTSIIVHEFIHALARGPGVSGMLAERGDRNEGLSKL